VWPTDTPTPDPTTTPDPTGSPTHTPTHTPTPTPTPTGNGVVPVFGTVASDPADNGFVQVSVSSDSAITQVTAYLTPINASGPTTTTVAGFTLVSGTAQDGVWRSPRLADLPGYTNYSVDVSATDTDGDTAAQASAGQIAFFKQARVTGTTLTPAMLDIQHQTLGASGVASVFDPRTGEVAPLADQALCVAVAGAGYSTTTAADGSYSVSVRPDLRSAGTGPVSLDITAWIPENDGTNGYVTVQHGTVPFTVSPSRIRLDSTVDRFNYGGHESVSGVVEYLYGGTGTRRPACR
jgi:hypothetical protein